MFIISPGFPSRRSGVLVFSDSRQELCYSNSLEVSDTFFGENGTITFNLDEDGFVCNARTVEEFMRLQAYDVFRQIERKTGANLCEDELDSLRRKSLSDAGIPDPVKLRHTSQVFINKQENF